MRRTCGVGSRTACPGASKDGKLDVRHMAVKLSQMPNIALLTIRYDDNLHVVDVLKRGIPARALASLAEALKLTMPTLAAAVLIPQRTLERRLAVNSVLKTNEAERALRLARLFAKAKDVFEDGDEAAEWFGEPLSVLGGHTPLELCATEAGAREVEQTLGRIEHGVFA
jgi:putative toxin-antitoxin system antitoxin component (TIGR02293 family)